MRQANSCCSRPVVHIFGNPLLRQPFHEIMSTRHFASVVVPATPAITIHHGKTTDSKVSVTSSNSTTGDSSNSNDIGGGSRNRRRIVERKAPLMIVRRADYLYFSLVIVVTLALNPYCFFLLSPFFLFFWGQTERAAERIQTMLSGKEEKIGVRVGVRRRGCNGLSYTLNYCEEPVKGDEEVAEHGVRVFVDPKAIFHVVGTTMDFEVKKRKKEFGCVKFCIAYL
jgi:iron-sulfur cluster assembly accessory protein